MHDGQLTKPEHRPRPVLQSYGAAIVPTQGVSSISFVPGGFVPGGPAAEESLRVTREAELEARRRRELHDAQLSYPSPARSSGASCASSGEQSKPHPVLASVHGGSAVERPALKAVESVVVV